MNKTVIVPVAAVLIGAALLLATQEVSAQTMPNPTQTLVQKIAQKFGLNQDDVQSVFDDHRKEMQSNMEARFEERLTQDVKDGEITEAQKQLLLAKHKELVANRQSTFQNWKNMTADQRKTAMQTQRQDLQSWAKQNNIDLKYLFPGMGMRFGHRMMMR